MLACLLVGQLFEQSSCFCDLLGPEIEVDLMYVICILQAGAARWNA